MKIKTQNLTGAALNWAVAKCEHAYVQYWPDGRVVFLHPNTEWTQFAPTTNWAQGGPIIERERIQLRPERGTEWRAYSGLLGPDTTGATPLIAAMRCFVASKLGDEVEVPKELVT